MQKVRKYLVGVVDNKISSKIICSTYSKITKGITSDTDCEQNVLAAYLKMTYLLWACHPKFPNSFPQTVYLLCLGALGQLKIICISWWRKNPQMRIENKEWPKGGNGKQKAGEKLLKTPEKLRTEK